jgi:hypothetical protein
VDTFNFDAGRPLALPPVFFFAIARGSLCKPTATYTYIRHHGVSSTAQ